MKEETDKKDILLSTFFIAWIRNPAHKLHHDLRLILQGEPQVVEFTNFVCKLQSIITISNTSKFKLMEIMMNVTYDSDET